VSFSVANFFASSSETMAVFAMRTPSYSSSIPSFRGGAKHRTRNPVSAKNWIPGSGLRPAPE
jgi:hypothetical protein